MKRTLLLLFVGVSLLLSCDIIKDPYEQRTNVISQDTIRRVLLEDFTGFACANCPAAGEKAHELADFFGTQLVVMKTHCTILAEPAPPEYPQDFRTRQGDSIATYYNVVGIPKGLINRKNWSGIPLQDYAGWASRIDSALKEPVIALINIENTFSETNNSLTTQITADYLQNGTAEDNLIVYIVEDSIIAPQNVEEVYVPNYVHNRMLRASLNGTWGSSIATTAPTSGTKITKTFNYTLREGMKPEHCFVIAALSNKSTKEIFQVIDAKFIK